MPCHAAGLYSTMSVVVVDRTSLLCPVAKSHLIAKRLKLLSMPENANRNQKVRKLSLRNSPDVIAMLRKP